MTTRSFRSGKRLSSRLAIGLAAVVSLCAALPAAGVETGALQQSSLAQELGRLTAGFDGRVGVCVLDAQGTTCLRGDERFPMQSVMKLALGCAVLDAADRGKLTLADPVLIRREDLSVYVQPLADLVGTDGYRTTIGDLVRRAIVDSDNAAADVLIRRLGGPRQVQAFLDRKHITGVRVDRDEHHLQSELVGIAWRQEYVDPARFQQAIGAVPAEQRTEAYRRYQADPRDTATPRGMVSLLEALASGRLLAPASTGRLLDILQHTTNFPDRLTAGLSAGWTIGHKPGTSGSWQGVAAATNDVGVLTAPDGGHVEIAVFIADSREPNPLRAALMAKICAAVIARYNQGSAGEPRKAGTAPGADDQTRVAHMVVVTGKDVSGVVFKRLGLPSQAYCWKQCLQEERCTGARWGSIAGEKAGQCQLLSGELTFSGLSGLMTEDGTKIVVIAARRELARSRAE